MSTTTLIHTMAIIALCPIMATEQNPAGEWMPLISVATKCATDAETCATDAEVVSCFPARRWFRAGKQQAGFSMAYLIDTAN
jgi:hypothetical protein